MIMNSGPTWRDAITDVTVLIYLGGNTLAALCLVFVSCLARPVLAELFTEAWRVRNELAKPLKYIMFFGGISASTAVTDIPEKLMHFLQGFM